jgi:hypothetical protein
MADGTGGGGGGAPPDILWTFPGQLSTDQDQNIFNYIAATPKAFVGTDVNLRVAPGGASVIIDFSINGVINSNLRVTIPIGSTYATTLFPFALAVNDQIRPIVTSPGGGVLGTSAIIRLRGQ